MSSETAFDVSSPICTFQQKLLVYYITELTLNYFNFADCHFLNYILNVLVNQSRNNCKRLDQPKRR